MTPRYVEHTAVEQTFRSIDYASDAERITTVRRRVRFAAVPFDERAAHMTFGGLGASGWPTAGVTMRFLVETDVESAGRITG